MKNIFFAINEKYLRSLLCKAFGLDSWHYQGFEDKEYAQITVQKVNAIIKHDSTTHNGLIVEVGCGLGDVIGNVKGEGIKKEGYDIDKRMVFAAKIMNYLKGYRVKYYCGGFRNLSEKKIECLIMINWLHNMAPEELKKEIDYVIKNNSIKWIVMDEVRNDTSKYRYEHDCEMLLGCYGYKRRYNGKRLRAAGNAYRNVVAYKMVF